jgi:hypothetical protein
MDSIMNGEYSGNQDSPQFITYDTYKQVSAKLESENKLPKSGIQFDESGLYDLKSYPLPSELPKELNHNGEPYYFKHYWPYLDALGNILGYVLRYENKAGIDKTIRPAFQTDGNGKWILKGIAKGEKRPLYRGELLLQKPELRALIVAGEPCCDLGFSLFKNKLNVITTQGGEGVISQGDFEDLKDHDVIHFPDNDPTGEKTVKDIIELSKKYQFKSLRIVNWPDELRHIRHSDGAEKNSQYRKWDICDLYEHYEKDSQKVWEFIMNNAKEPEAENSERSFAFKHISAFEIKPAQWLIKPYIERDSLVQIFGDPGSGKSFIGIDIACSVATGKDFHGCQTTKGGVLYIAGEGQNGILKRFQAWNNKYQVDVFKHEIFLSTMPTALCNSDAVEIIKKAIKDINIIPYLIVIDTLARNFGNGDENSNQDMSKFIASLDQIRVPDKATILPIHHTGHGDKSRSRGAMALKGALDAEYKMSKDNHGIVRFENTKIKDFEKPDGLSFKIISVELGKDEETGEDITSGILERIDYQPKETKANAGRGKNQELALSVYDKILNKHERTLKQSGYSTEQAKVSKQDWSQACAEKGLNKKRQNEVLKSCFNVQGVYLYPIAN